MMSIFTLIILITSAFAYVPTVESLFRFGSNPDVTQNEVVINLSIKKIQSGEKEVSGSLVTSDEDQFYKIYLTNLGEHLKIGQVRFKNASFLDSTIEHKVYSPHLDSSTLKPTAEFAPKGIFYGMLNSILFNNGSLMVNYLKSLGVPVRLNSEIINREKVEFLASYKRYLHLINKERGSKKVEANPMRPEDSAGRDRAQAIMDEPMYVDTKHVSLTKDEHGAAWSVIATGFESTFAYNSREIKKIKYKSSLGDFEITCKDFWRANGVHFIPRYILIKTYSGQNYQVEILGMRQNTEKEIDVIRRVKSWEDLLKGKESLEGRPEFLL